MSMEIKDIFDNSFITPILRQEGFPRNKKQTNKIVSTNKKGKSSLVSSWVYNKQRSSNSSYLNKKRGKE